nr:immunoglobulin heavy chain junction region [Macaca mulatta]MOX15790.1 immunoglobulin heavy chain junction region [Macaca mulatta]MOX16250.1 immunoglobulin heavy chain junction region [Macaca mulatta]MOX16281.1 immunoglobulin heavy chain junction region [Macaca mulatta]MOX16415.1 immunoglobulin heavy chain junction region [Macaca mulatta]
CATERLSALSHYYALDSW